MRGTRYGWMFGLALVCPHGSAHAATAPDALRSQLLQITQQLVDALPRGDRAPWQRWLADDAMLVDEFGRITHKTDTVASLHPFPAGFSGSIELRDAHVRQYGDSAVMQVEEYERETVFGQQLVVRYQSLLTFVRQAGAWRVVGYADVTLPTAPPELHVAGLAPSDYTGTYRYAPERVWTVADQHGVLSYTTHAGGTPNVLHPIAKDVFMGSDDERNLFIFQRDAHGRVDAMIERRKFNDLRLTRDPLPTG